MEQNVFLCISVLFWDGFRRTEKELYLKWSLVFIFWCFLDISSLLSHFFLLRSVYPFVSVYCFCLLSLFSKLVNMSVCLFTSHILLNFFFIYLFIHIFIHLFVYLIYAFIYTFYMHFSPSSFSFSLYLYILLVYRFLLCIFLLIYLSLPSSLFF